MKCLQLAEIHINCVNVCIHVNKSLISKSGVILSTHHALSPRSTIWDFPQLISGPLHKILCCVRNVHMLAHDVFDVAKRHC